MTEDKQRSTRCTRPVKIGVMFVAAVIIAVVVIVLVGVANNKDSGETPSFQFQEICVVQRPSLHKLLTITCNFGNTADVDPDIRDKLRAAEIDVPATTVKLNGRENLFKFNCLSSRPNEILCSGPEATCSFAGTLEISIIDSKGHVVFSNTTSVAVAEKSMGTFINQSFAVDADSLTSNFTLTCGVREACEDLLVEAYLEDTPLVKNGDVHASCGTSSKSETAGYGVTCTYVVRSEMIASLSNLNMTCVLRGNDSLIRQRKLFELPYCWEKTPACNCSIPRDTCQGTCDVMKSCDTRHEKVLNPGSLECPTQCAPAWCRSSNNSLLIDTDHILQSVCSDVWTQPQKSPSSSPVTTTTS